MNQDIILRREIKTDTWLIQGEIAMADSRPELNCVLQYLHDHPGANAVKCSKHLFGGKISHRVVADRLLNIAHLYGLTESERGQYRLIESGSIALQKDQILVPEDGCWKLCVCIDEPLLPHQLLSIEAHDEPSAASTGLKKYRDDLKKRSDNFSKVPKEIKELVGLQKQPIGGGKEVRVDKIENKGECISPRESFHIEWNVTAGIVEVKRDQSLIFTRSVKPISRRQALEVLLHSEGLFEQWDEQTEVLAVAFDETTEAERVSMKRAISVKSPSIHKFGVFDPMTLPDISVSALSDTDARKWAKWRLNNNIDMYASANKYETWKEKALAPFKEFDFSLPDRAELANQLWFEERQQNQHTWHVMAAQDWNL